MTIPEEAIEAAEDALRADLWDGDPENLPPTMTREAEIALEAAEPHLRKKWAEELERAMFKVESVHQFGFGYHGFKCLCGFETIRNRSRTEHITQAVRNLLEGAGE